MSMPTPGRGGRREPRSVHTSLEGRRGSRHGWLQRRTQTGVPTRFPGCSGKRGWEPVWPVTVGRSHEVTAQGQRAPNSSGWSIKVV